MKGIFDRLIGKPKDEVQAIVDAAFPGHNVPVSFHSFHDAHNPTVPQKVAAKADSDRDWELALAVDSTSDKVASEGHRWVKGSRTRWPGLAKTVEEVENTCTEEVEKKEGEEYQEELSQTVAELARLNKEIRKTSKVSKLAAFLPDTGTCILS